MSRAQRNAPGQVGPEALFEKAVTARTVGLRARYARRALEHEDSYDATSRAMLIRQLYVAAMEKRKFVEARSYAEMLVRLKVMVDVAYQDLARACLGTGDLDEAVRSLRMAARHGPPSRRSFHLSMLGALLYLNGHAELARLPLNIAARWSATDKALCRTQLALVERELGAAHDIDFDALRDSLEGATHKRGYSEYLLGEVCAILGDDAMAQAYFDSFVRRVTCGRVALSVALQAEIRRARRFLSAHRRVKRA